MHDGNAELRRRLLTWVNVALDAVEPARCVEAALREHARRPTAILAFGKAAIGMARGAGRALGEHIERALLIAPAPPSAPLPPRWEFLRGDHPLPGVNSLAAGNAVARWLRELERDVPLLVLISGGGSALVELPVTGMTLADLERMNRWLLASGLDIQRINAIRSRFSHFKRGGLLQLAGQRAITGLLISDVPGDSVIDIASGPLSYVPLKSPDVEVPAWLHQLHATLPMPPVNEPEARADIRIVARNADALDAIARAAAGDGIPCMTRSTMHGSAMDVGAEIAKQLLDAPAGVHLFGGETTVRLPDRSGRGGRNQQLALAAAREIAGAENVLLLALGTDGVDGNSEDAGALVDGGTFDRIRDAGLDPVKSLENADSNTALAAAGDVIHTGPTGTNVMDIVIALKVA